MIQTLAEEYARIYHEGQFRTSGKLPYVVHPECVVRYLRQLGVNDDVSQAIAWLHDTLEDTSLTYGEIRNTFGVEVAHGVYLLTRNVDREQYKKRLSSAPMNIKMIKLCDTLHNITTLECLSPESIERKINDCISYYIPMAEEICPVIAEQMDRYINEYL